jgi:hypothetical protein
VTPFVGVIRHPGLPPLPAIGLSYADGRPLIPELRTALGAVDLIVKGGAHGRCQTAPPSAETLRAMLAALRRVLASPQGYLHEEDFRPLEAALAAKLRESEPSTPSS